ncbi:unnamed protein product [Amoebophrya sp. A120]|nr:unnamed protein product [Amoebophrya sp. A120]|eukprot:GSA120T00009216001.1
MRKRLSASSRGRPCLGHARSSAGRSSFFSLSSRSGAPHTASTTTSTTDEVDARTPGCSAATSRSRNRRQASRSTSASRRVARCCLFLADKCGRREKTKIISSVVGAAFAEPAHVSTNAGDKKTNADSIQNGDVVPVPLGRDQDEDEPGEMNNENLFAAPPAAGPAANPRLRGAAKHVGRTAPPAAASASSSSTAEVVEDEEWEGTDFSSSSSSSSFSERDETRGTGGPRPPPESSATSSAPASTREKILSGARERSSSQKIGGSETFGGSSSSARPSFLEQDEIDNDYGDLEQQINLAAEQIRFEQDQGRAGGQEETGFEFIARKEVEVEQNRRNNLRGGGKVTTPSTASYDEQDTTAVDGMKSVHQSMLQKRERELHNRRNLEDHLQDEQEHHQSRDFDLLSFAVPADFALAQLPERPLDELMPDDTEDLFRAIDERKETFFSGKRPENVDEEDGNVVAEAGPGDHEALLSSDEGPTRSFVQQKQEEIDGGGNLLSGWEQEQKRSHSDEAQEVEDPGEEQDASGGGTTAGASSFFAQKNPVTAFRDRRDRRQDAAKSSIFGEDDGDYTVEDEDDDEVDGQQIDYDQDARQRADSLVEFGRYLRRLEEDRELQQDAELEALDEDDEEERAVTMNKNDAVLEEGSSTTSSSSMFLQQDEVVSPLEEVENPFLEELEEGEEGEDDDSAATSSSVLEHGRAAGTTKKEASAATTKRKQAGDTSTTSSGTADPAKEAQQKVSKLASLVQPGGSGAVSTLITIGQKIGEKQGPNPENFQIPRELQKIYDEKIKPLAMKVLRPDLAENYGLGAIIAQHANRWLSDAHIPPTIGTEGVAVQIVFPPAGIDGRHLHPVLPNDLNIGNKLTMEQKEQLAAILQGQVGRILQAPAVVTAPPYRQNNNSGKSYSKSFLQHQRQTSGIVLLPYAVEIGGYTFTQFEIPVRFLFPVPKVKQLVTLLTAVEGTEKNTVTNQEGKRVVFHPGTIFAVRAVRATKKKAVSTGSSAAGGGGGLSSLFGMGNKPTRVVTAAHHLEQGQQAGSENPSTYADHSIELVPLTEMTEVVESLGPQSAKDARKDPTRKVANDFSPTWSSTVRTKNVLQVSTKLLASQIRVLQDAERGGPRVFVRKQTGDTARGSLLPKLYQLRWSPATINAMVDKIPADTAQASRVPKFELVEDTQFLRDLARAKIAIGDFLENWFTEKLETDKPEEKAKTGKKIKKLIDELFAAFVQFALMGMDPNSGTTSAGAQVPAPDGVRVALFPIQDTFALLPTQKKSAGMMSMSTKAKAASLMADFMGDLIAERDKQEEVDVADLEKLQKDGVKTQKPPKKTQVAAAAKMYQLAMDMIDTKAAVSSVDVLTPLVLRLFARFNTAGRQAGTDPPDAGNKNPVQFGTGRHFQPDRALKELRELLTATLAGTQLGLFKLNEKYNTDEEATPVSLAQLLKELPDFTAFLPGAVMRKRENSLTDAVQRSKMFKEWGVGKRSETLATSTPEAMAFSAEKMFSSKIKVTAAPQPPSSFLEKVGSAAAFLEFGSGSGRGPEYFPSTGSEKFKTLRRIRRPASSFVHLRDRYGKPQPSEGKKSRKNPERRSKRGREKRPDKRRSSGKRKRRPKPKYRGYTLVAWANWIRENGLEGVPEGLWNWVETMKEKGKVKREEVKYFDRYVQRAEDWADWGEDYSAAEGAAVPPGQRPPMENRVGPVTPARRDLPVQKNNEGNGECCKCAWLDECCAKCNCCGKRNCCNEGNCCKDDGCCTECMGDSKNNAAAVGGAVAAGGAGAVAAGGKCGRWCRCFFGDICFMLCCPTMDQRENKDQDNGYIEFCGWFFFKLVIGGLLVAYLLDSLAHAKYVPEFDVYDFPSGFPVVTDPIVLVICIIILSVVTFLVVFCFVCCPMRRACASTKVCKCFHITRCRCQECWSSKWCNLDLCCRNFMLHHCSCCCTNEKSMFADRRPRPDSAGGAT